MYCNSFCILRVQRNFTDLLHILSDIGTLPGNDHLFSTTLSRSRIVHSVSVIIHHFVITDNRYVIIYNDS